MSLAVLLALSILSAEPVGDAAPSDSPPAADSAAPAPAPGETEDIPPGAPTDDYGFVGWCSGALDEYLTIYPKVLPDLVEIDKLFGSPVREDQPYESDVAAEHKALKRFEAAMLAAEKASPQPIAPRGQAAIAQGRAIWSKVEGLPGRQLADAWLFWGIPVRCETTAKSLKLRPALANAGQPTAAADSPAPAR